MSVGLSGDVDTGVGTSHTSQDVRVSFLHQISDHPQSTYHGQMANKRAGEMEVRDKMWEGNEGHGAYEWRGGVGTYGVSLFGAEIGSELMSGVQDGKEDDGVYLW